MGHVSFHVHFHVSPAQLRHNNDGNSRRQDTIGREYNKFCLHVYTFVLTMNIVLKSFKIIMINYLFTKKFFNSVMLDLIF